jgi:hypothetical protein
MVLVAGAALHAIYAMPVRTAPDVHHVLVHIIALPGIISGRVAIHAAWIPQYRHNCLERRGCPCIIVATGLGLHLSP